MAPEEAAQQILLYLEREGYIRADAPLSPDGLGQATSDGPNGKVLLASRDGCAGPG
jgi:hypothetical protein